MTNDEKETLLVPTTAVIPTDDKETDKDKGNPVMGVVFFVMAGLAFALNFIFAKVIYESKP